MRSVHAMVPLGAVLLLLPSAGAAAATDRLVLLIENRSANPAAAAELQPALTAVLARKGYEVVAGPAVDAFAGARAASIAAESAAGLIEHFQARGLIAVTIRFALGPGARSRGPTASPAVGLIAKAYFPGRSAWRSSLGLIADGPAPEGKQPPPLAAIACARLLWSFPRGNGPTLVSVADEWDALTGSSPAERARTEAVPSYDVLIERQRASRTGPRFPLKLRKNR